jgi:hypothetical protein
VLPEPPPFPAEPVVPPVGPPAAGSVEPDVAVGRGVGVGATVAAGLGVAVGAGVGVGCGVGAGVGDGVCVGVGRGVGLAVGRGVGVGVGWGVAVGRGVSVGVGRGVSVGVGRGVSVGVGRGVGVGVGWGVAVGRGVSVGVGRGVGVGVGWGVAVGRGVGGGAVGAGATIVTVGPEIEPSNLPRPLELKTTPCAPVPSMRTETYVMPSFATPVVGVMSCSTPSIATRTQSALELWWFVQTTEKVMGVDGVPVTSETAGLESAVDPDVAPAGPARAASQKATTATTPNSVRPRELCEVRNATIPYPVSDESRPIPGPSEHRRSRRPDKWYGGPVAGTPVAPFDCGSFRIGAAAHRPIRAPRYPDGGLGRDPGATMIWPC